MLPTPVLRLLNILSDAFLQNEEEFEGLYGILFSNSSLFKSRLQNILKWEQKMTNSFSNKKKIFQGFPISKYEFSERKYLRPRERHWRMCMYL